MKKTKIFFLLFLSLIFFILFFTFTLIVKSKILIPFDFNTTVKLQNHIPKKIDSFFSFLSLVGSVEFLSVFLLIIALLQKKIIAFLIFIPFGAAHLIEIVGKGFFHHPGPPFLFIRYNLGFVFPSAYINTGSSYPSGHSLRIMFFSVILAYLTSRLKTKTVNKLILYLLLLLFVGVMLISRVSLGEHWTTDVIAGSFLGLSAGFFSLIFL